MTTPTIHLINGSSTLTTPSDYELFDDSGYAVGSSPQRLVPFLYLVAALPTKKAPRTGHRLRDVIRDMEGQSARAVAEFQDARRWVAEEMYGSEPTTFQSIRLKLGLSQAGLAKLASTTQTRISKIENGEELPRFDTMKRLAVALHIDMNTLGFAIDAATARKNK